MDTLEHLPGRPARRPLDPKLEKALQKNELLRPFEVGVQAREFVIAEKRGEIRRLCNGVYLGMEYPLEVWSLLAAWTHRYPNAVACLVTTARFWNILPKKEESKLREYWVLLPRGEVKYSPPGLRTIGVPFSEIPPEEEAAKECGILSQEVHGCQVRYTDADRTVLDMLRYGDRRSVEIPPESSIQALQIRSHQPDFDRQRFIGLAKRLGVWDKLDAVVTTALDSL